MDIINQCNFESNLIEIANAYLEYHGANTLHKYQQLNIYVNSKNVVKNILKTFKFKDIGNVYDHTKLPIPDSLSIRELTSDYKMFQRVAVSKKYTAVLFLNGYKYSISCRIYIDTKNIKKFMKQMNEILKQDMSKELFDISDFKCEKIGDYIEVNDSSDDETVPVVTLKKSVPKEKVVFDDNSTISEVMSDIITFFGKDTVKLYSKLDLPYKRGIILHGEPGNGKSTMLREIIRSVPDIPKVVINCNNPIIVTVLQSLIETFNNKKVIIIIEDIDSMITLGNRSAFLNILDGIHILSGIYFIGTTNYPERIDPAFMNRSGRFDRTYKIDNPSKNARKLFFKSKDICTLFSDYKYDGDIIDLFVSYSEDLPMATLKELITATSYKLVSDKSLTLENAVKLTSEMLKSSKDDHTSSYNKYDSKNHISPILNNIIG